MGISLFLLNIPAISQKSMIGQSGTSDSVFTFVEEMPIFPGGEKAMMAFLTKHFKLPDFIDAYSALIIVGFIVEKDSSLINISIIKSGGAAMDKEIERIVSSMPKWIPGKHNGKTVRVRMNIPLRIELSE